MEISSYFYGPLRIYEHYCASYTEKYLKVKSKDDKKYFSEYLVILDQFSRTYSVILKTI